MGFQRTGLRTIRDVAYRLCQLVTAFTPIITKAFGSNAELLAALVAANVACGVLVETADQELEYGD